MGYGEPGYGDSDHDGYTKERDGDIQRCFGDWHDKIWLGINVGLGKE